MQTKPRELIWIFTFSIPRIMIHSNLQPAPIIVDVSIVKIRTLMKVQQFYILEMTKRFN